MTALADGLVVLPGHRAAALAQSPAVAETAPSTRVGLAITLPLRNQSDLAATLQALYDPASPQYQQYLSTDEFIDRYCPTVSDYAEVTQYAQAMGLTITGTHANRLILDVAGSAAQVDNAFNVHLSDHISADGRRYYAADADPAVPASIADKILAVVGLDNAGIPRPHYVVTPPNPLDGILHPFSGSGPNNCLIPSDIRTAYNFPTTLNGSGQTLALMELDGYTAGDIAAYEKAYQLPNVPLSNVLIDGYNGQPSMTGGEIEVSLDIEMMAAVAPSASKILVYEGPLYYNGSYFQGCLDTYNRIATDNAAKEVSSSWGMAEMYVDPASLSSENQIFTEMAAQGQSLYAASGDSGAYADGSTISVGDPGSEPYVCAVGGTSIATNANHSYASETTWNSDGGASGGGISQIWTKPGYQSGRGQSTTMRNVPDVSLDADPLTGYWIAVDGSWMGVGGTSCAAPLWAGFTALVNQQRALNNTGTLGFPNPALYTIGGGARYSQDFHDITTGNNFYYNAGAGYDNATGWGSFNATNLIGDLAPTVAAAVPTKLAATAVSSRQINLTWSASAGATGYVVYRGTVSGGPYGVKVGSPTACSLSDTGLTPTTAYYYVVEATNTSGASAMSTQATATTLPAPPSPPSSLSATAVSTTQINLSWPASANATGYTVLRGTKSGGPYGTTVGTSTATTYSDKTPASGTTYYYVVQATNAGGAGGNSPEASATTPLAVPTNLAASPASSTQIQLTWTASTGATGYVVLRGTKSGGPYSAQAGTPAGTSFTDTHLSASTAYYYVVYATGSGSPSANSAQASATTYGPPPSAPTKLAATAVSTSQINLTWTPSAGATGYTVLRGTASGGPYGYQAGNPTAASFSDTSVGSGATYYYVVEATNPGGSSPNSGEASATTLLAAPTGLSARTLSATQISLIWSPAAGATGYVILRGTQHGGPYGTRAGTSATASFSDSGVSANTAYYYVVYATGPGSAGPNSNEATATTLPMPPAAPTKLAATPASPTQVNLTWTGSATATGYTVLRGTKSGGPYSTQVGTSASTQLSDNNTAPGAAYYYVVVAGNSGGTSGGSNEATATTPPATPVGLSASGTSTSTISLTWSSSAGATGYVVLRGTQHGGPYSTQAGTTKSTTFLDTKLAINTTYFYVVYATGPGISSANSAEVSTTTWPNAPATPTKLAASTVSASQINLTWTGSSGATGYAVYRGTAAGGPYPTQAGTATTASFSDKTVSAGLTYYYVVQATNVGGASGNSNQASATTLAGSPPTNVSATAVSQTQIKLTWTGSAGAAGYNVLRSQVHGGPYTKIGTSTATSYTDNGLSANSQYYYVVEAANTAGAATANSAEATATTPPNAPAPPTNVVAKAVSSSQVNITWNASPGAVGYEVWIGLNAAGPFVPDGTNPVTSTTNFTNTGLPPSCTVYYVITAFNLGGGSPYSAPASTTTWPK